MEARAARLAEMIPIHRKRGLEAEARAAAALARLEDPTTSVIDQVQSERTYSAELRLARTEDRTCEWYEQCIKQWTAK